MATLNGWQRLWALVSGVWAVLWVTIYLVVPRTNWVAIAIAVVPPVLLYAAGLGVAWVRRGFRG
jgi:hypothetical protein